MAARAKFYCESVKAFQGNTKEVTMRTQYDPNIEEDKKFHSATPSGELKFMLENPALNDFFVPGKRYYLDITPAD